MVDIKYSIFINGFPKAGTHLVELMVKTIAPPMPADRPWAGSFSGNSWTETWVEDYKLFRQIGWLADGSYAKGHMGYRRDIELFLWGIGATVLFVIRDPRDVAISQVHHILNGGNHPEPEPYQKAYDQDGFKGPLRMVIEGYQGKEPGPDGPNYYSGVMARWKHYAPWLDVPWILALRFEDLIHKREEMAEQVIKTCVARAALRHGKIARVSKKALGPAIERMAAATYQTDQSPTFRKGTDGQWREHFDGEIMDLWQKHDPEFWTSRLGYEWD